MMCDKAEKNLPKEQRAYTYILRCEDGSLYTGITTDFDRRFLTHKGQGKASARYTRSHKVTSVAALWEAKCYRDAAKLEYRLKRLKKSEKEEILLNPALVFYKHFPALLPLGYSYMLPAYLQAQEEKGEKAMLPFYQSDEAHAKINLDLYVKARREDGFHELSTAMASLALSDTVTLSAMAADRLTAETETVGADLPAGEENLTTRAALLFCRRRDITAEIKIHVVKRIPIGAGLAGGSADAAAVLRLLAAAFPGQYSEEALSDLAAEIGSDVNFCLHKTLSRCTGRGEKLERILSPITLPLVLVKPDFSVSTPKAFRALDLRFSNFEDAAFDVSEKTHKMDEALRNGDLSSVVSLSYNIFEEVTPEVLPIREHLCALGALLARMSGSGPTVYAVFSTLLEAEAAAQAYGDGAIVTEALPFS